MHKILLLLTITPLIAMENPDHPRYHINNKIVYLREIRESGDQDFKTVSEFNKSFTEIPLAEKKPEPEDRAVINTGVPNKTKVIVAIIAAGSTIATALISSLLTYYTKTCK